MDLLYENYRVGGWFLIAIELVMALRIPMIYFMETSLYCTEYWGIDIKSNTEFCRVHQIPNFKLNSNTSRCDCPKA